MNYTTYIAKGSEPHTVFLRVLFYEHSGLGTHFDSVFYTEMLPLFLYSPKVLLI